MAKSFEHDWSKGERCLLCGDKDWMDSVCSGPRNTVTVAVLDSGGELPKMQTNRHMFLISDEADAYLIAAHPIAKQYGGERVGYLKDEIAWLIYTHLRAANAEIARLREGATQLISTAERVWRKYGHDDSLHELDWVEWTDVRDAIAVLRALVAAPPTPPEETL